MNKNKINFLNIEKAIDEFENQLDFEFIPVVAPKSSYTEHISWVLSLLFLIFFIGVIDGVFSTILPDAWISKTPFYIASPFVAFIFGLVLDKSDCVDRFFITKAERQRQVWEKAELLFYRNHWNELKSGNALLLYISVMERQIVLFPDPRLELENIKKINEELLKILQQSFKKSDFEAGLLNCIEHLKINLMPQFSKIEKKPNNVPNKLIWLGE